MIEKAKELLNEGNPPDATAEVAGWAQAVLTALNVGDVKSGSPIHLKLREVMIAYRESKPQGCVVGGDFYNGIEWLACWLLDNAEGETITEEQLRPWAVKAWEAHLNKK